MTIRQRVPLLHFEITGHGPAVVLLHGFMASTKYWAQVSERLAKNHTVVSIDLLGFGKSPKPSFSRYDYDAHLRSLEATLETAGVPAKFVLMGHSMGALMAMRYARHHADRVERLVLANMPIWLTSQEAKTDVLSAHRVFKYVLNPTLHPLFWLVFQVAVKRELLPSRLSTELMKRAEYIFQSSAASRLRSLRNVIYSAKVEADLAALTVKTTLLTGLQDRQAYVENMLGLALSPLIQTKLVAGGHHLPLTQPALVASLVRS